MIPTNILGPLTNALPYLDFASIGPGIISTLLLLLSAGFACCSDKSFLLSKLFIVVSNPALLVTFVWYLLLLVGSLFADRPVFADQWSAITTACTTNLPALQAAYDDANQAVVDAQAAGAPSNEVVSMQSSLATAQSQLEDFTELCACLDEIPDNLKRLA